MKKGMKIILVLFAVLFAVMLAGCVALHMYDIAKKQYVTDPVIAHIPLRADLDFPDEPILNRTVDIIYTLTPQVDVKTDVSEGLILPEGIMFVENNLPIGQITLSKGRKYRYSAKIKTVEIGNWMIYASPGVYANVNVVFGGEVSTVWIQKVWKAKEPLTRYRLRENISKEQQDVLMNITKNWLRGYGIQKYEREEFNCTIISRPASGIHNINIKCYGCELMGYSNSRLHEKYYFIIEEDLLTNKTKVRNVYRWAYWTPSGYESKPVCEEIRIKGGGNNE